MSTTRLDQKSQALHFPCPNSPGYIVVTVGPNVGQRKGGYVGVARMNPGNRRHALCSEKGVRKVRFRFHAMLGQFICAHWRASHPIQLPVRVPTLLGPGTRHLEKYAWRFWEQACMEALRLWQACSSNVHTLLEKEDSNLGEAAVCPATR
eukprot:6175595-Pleurochrysis_carterae.AAC.5